MVKKWKKWMAAVCSASMLITMPGISVLADEIQEEDYIVVEAEDPEETVESVDSPSEEMMDIENFPSEESVDSPDEIIEDSMVDQGVPEEVVGGSEIQVGDGVTATFDPDTGAVEFSSQEGVLWSGWLERLWIYKDKIKSIKVVSGIVYLPADSSRLFRYLHYLQTLDLNNFDTSNVTNMSEMFNSCSRLQSLDLSRFDTSYVTDMGSMFSGCSSLTELNVNNFDTTNVTNMGSMFSGCSSLTELNVSNFDTTNATNMGSMFSGCSCLTELDVSGFDTTNVTDMGSMFSGCSGLTELDVSGFDTTNVTNMGGMFNSCNSLQSLDLSSFDTSSVTNMRAMLRSCGHLQSLELSSLDTSNVTNMGEMFSNCISLQSLELSSLDTSNVTNMGKMFNHCSSLIELNVSNFDTTNVMDMSEMFNFCRSLRSLDLSSFDTSNVTSMKSMFYYCRELQSLDLSNLDTSNVTDMGTMLSECISLQSLDLRGFDTSNVTNMRYMFYNCSSLKSLDVSGFDTTNVTSMGYMFSGCRSLTELDVSDFDTTNVTDMDNMFSQCSSLQSLDLSSFDTTNVTSMNAMFSQCRSLQSLDLRDFDTSNVISMRYMFKECKRLTCLDLSGLDTSSVTNMENMFSDCSSLKSLDLSNFDTSNVVETSEMFSNCSSLSLLKTPKKNVLSIRLPGIMFDEQGNDYQELPILNESQILKSEKPDLSDCTVTLTVTNYTYDGTEKKPTVTVKNQNVTLVSGTDYTVEYIDNINAGTATVRVIGIGKYKGEKSVTFTIDKADAKLIFTESGINKNTADTPFTNTLTKITDGTVTFSSSDTKVATIDNTSGLVTINGIGTVNITVNATEGKNYKAGSAEYTLTVEANRRDITDLAVALSQTRYAYDGTSKQPTVTMKIDDTALIVGTDYTVQYSNNIAAGTAIVTVTGIGNYKGEKDVTFTIDKVDISDLTVALEKTSYIYDGTSKQPEVTIKNDKMILTAGTDYNVQYSNNIDAGTAFVKLIGLGNYKGEKSVTFTINKADAVLRFDKSSINKLTTDTKFSNALTKTTDGTVIFESSNTEVAVVDSSSGEVTIKGVGETTITANADEGRNYKAGTESYLLTVTRPQIIVGDGVTATFAPETGAVELTSQDGELWSNWVDRLGVSRDEITSIKVVKGKVYLPRDENVYSNRYDKIFGNLTNLTSLDLSGFDSSRVTNMSYMFSGCESLESLDLSSLNTSNVIDMTCMFGTCSSMKSLDLSHFNMSKVENASGMFLGCMELTSLNVKFTGFTHATNMRYMFSFCSNIKNLDLSSFSTLSVTDMSGMFSGCSSLTSLNLSSFSTKYVTNMTNMFSGCSSLTSINLSRFDTSSVTNMENMFADCSSLASLNVSSFDTSNVRNMKSMFSGCKSLKSMDLSSFKTVYVNKMGWMFKDCTGLQSLDLSSFCIYSDDPASMLSGCTGLNTLKTPWAFLNLSIALPLTMYDEKGNAYTKLANILGSITLTRKNPKASGFSDVQDPNHAYYKAIYWAADAGITKGYPDGTFGINRNCTRGEMMMFLWRYAGKPAATTVSKSPFSDVPKTHAFYKAILWGSQKGITKGYPNGTFGIDRNVTRGECMMFLWRLKGKPAPNAVANAPFPAVPKSHAFYNAVLWGYQKKITTGFTSGKLKGKFGVNENCSRGQIVTFLYRAK